MHLIRFTSNTKPSKGNGIMLHSTESKSSATIKSLGVTLNHLLTLAIHTAAAVTITKALPVFVGWVTKKRED